MQVLGLHESRWLKVACRTLGYKVYHRFKGSCCNVGEEAGLNCRRYRWKDHAAGSASDRGCMRDFKETGEEKMVRWGLHLDNFIG